MESARAATGADRDLVVELAGMAVAELAPTRGGPMWARREARPLPVAPSVDADLADPDTEVVVGLIDDAVVGYGVVRAERLRDGDLLGVVDDLFVLSGARGVGVGEAMMDLVLDWCIARRCIGLDAIALPGNRATKNFFERYGLTARAIVVHRAFLPPSVS